MNQQVTGLETPTIKRDIALDALRGLMLVVIAIDHFGGPLTRLSWETLGFVSAGEGFVFLSGYMAGLVYGKQAQRDPGLLRSRARRRAWTIYRFHIILLIGVLLFTLLSDGASANWSSHATLFKTDPVDALILGFALLYQPPLLDILPMYTVFLLLTPAVVTAFQRGAAPAVLLISAGLWLAAQFGVREYLAMLLSGHVNIDLGFFNILAWQALFIFGSWFGYRRVCPGMHARWGGKSLIAIVLPLATALFLVRHGVVSLDILDLIRATDRRALAWLRMANFVSVAFVIAWLLQLGWPPVPILHWLIVLRNWLGFLGQHSLQVFSYHVLMSYLIIPLQWKLASLPGPPGRALEVAGCLLFIASLSLPALVHRSFQRQTRAARTPTRLATDDLVEQRR